MLKKVLIGAGILAALVAVAFGLVALEAGKKFDEVLQEKETEFRQYAAMTAEEQDAYVERHLNDLLNAMGKEKADRDYFDSQEEYETYAEKIAADPEATAVGVKLGRAIVAMIILSSDSIVADLSAEDKAKFRQEADDLPNRIGAYSNAIEKYEVLKKKS